MIDGIPIEVREFIFDHVDAVLQLEALLFLRSDAPSGRWWDANSLSRELYGSAAAISAHLAKLKDLGILEERPESPPAYRYRAPTAEIGRVIDRLAEVSRTHRHRLLELIFSPIKKARPLSMAFKFKKDGKDNA